ncbi:hypothetical protein RCL1_001775 [Eukaryota sp. TZLM3-RCL]
MSLPLSNLSIIGDRKQSICEYIVLEDGNKKPRPTVIAIAGGTASGKTTLCRKIKESIGLETDRVAIISQDSFYKVLSPEERELARAGKYNFDNPEAFDKALFIETIQKLREGQSVNIPTYDYSTSSRTAEVEVVSEVDTILVEGILVLSPEYVEAGLYDVKIFVDTDSDLRLLRRILRDQKERGRSVESILNQYLNQVKPSYDTYIKPCKRSADIVVPWSHYNAVAVKLIVRHIKHFLMLCESHSNSSESSDDMMF